MQNMLDNIPIGTNTDCHTLPPDLAQMTDDILVNGFCEKSGLTLDEVIDTAETDVTQYVSILKHLVTHQSHSAKVEAKKYVQELAYKMLERLYK